MSPTDYEIARLISLCLLLFALGCGPAYLAERASQRNKENDHE